MVHLRSSAVDEAIAAMIAPELPDVAEFWAGCARGVLRVQWCPNCARHHWPPRPVCRFCHGPVEWVDADDAGRVYSWTVAHVSPLPGFAELTPYAVVIAELPAASGIRVVARFAGDPESLAIGADVVLDFEKVAADRAVPVWHPPVAGTAADGRGDATGAATEEDR